MTEACPALCLGALAAGEALGTKAVGVVFVPPLAGGWRPRLILFGSKALRTKIVQLLVVLLLPLLTGGYWYACNALLTGNPLYPLEVRVLGHTLLRGWYGPDAMRLSPYYIPFGDWRALVDTLLAVLDPRLVPFWVLAVAGAGVVGGGARRRRRQDGRAARRTDGEDGLRRQEHGLWRGFGLLAILNVALYWVFIPYRSQQRFMLAGTGAGGRSAGSAASIAGDGCACLVRRSWVCICSRRNAGRLAGRAGLFPGIFRRRCRTISVR